MSAIELTLPVGILGPLPILDLAVGAHPKMASGFLWGNPHEEDRERRLGKGSAVVLKELHYCGLFFPCHRNFQLFRNMLPIPTSPCSQRHTLSKRHGPGWTLMDAITQRQPMGSQARCLEGRVQCASHV